MELQEASMELQEASMELQEASMELQEASLRSTREMRYELRVIAAKRE